MPSAGCLGDAGTQACQLRCGCGRKPSRDSIDSSEQHICAYTKHDVSLLTCRSLFRLSPNEVLCRYAMNTEISTSIWKETNGRSVIMRERNRTHVAQNFTYFSK